MTDITIILDNGGGITLQCETTNYRYQHHYTLADQCAVDLQAAVAGSDIQEWDGNEDDWLEPSDDDIRNGGYRIVRVDDTYSLSDIELALAQHDSWANAMDLAAALRAAQKGD